MALRVGVKRQAALGESQCMQHQLFKKKLFMQVVGLDSFLQTTEQSGLLKNSTKVL